MTEGYHHASSYKVVRWVDTCRLIHKVDIYPYGVYLRVKTHLHPASYHDFAPAISTVKMSKLVSNLTYTY